MLFFGAAQNVMVPATINGIAVRHIGSTAFENAAVHTVTLPNGLQTIGARAFAGCVNLVEVSIPVSVTSIANDAFAGSPGVTIRTTMGSAAYHFARLHGIPLQLQ